MSILSKAVDVANNVTRKMGMQVSVTVKTLTTDAGVGDPQYKTRSLFGVLEFKQRLVRTDSGEMVTSNSNVTFVGPVNIAIGSTIVFKDGSKGVVISAESPVDASGKLITRAYL